MLLFQCPCLAERGGGVYVGGVLAVALARWVHSPTQGQRVLAASIAKITAPLSCSSSRHLWGLGYPAGLRHPDRKHRRAGWREREVDTAPWPSVVLVPTCRVLCSHRVTERAAIK